MIGRTRRAVEGGLRFVPEEGAATVSVPKTEHDHMGGGHGRPTRSTRRGCWMEHTGDEGILRLDLQPDGDGACLLVFTTVFGGRGSAPALGAGRHAGLDPLESPLDGRPAEAWERRQVGHARSLT